MIPKGQLLAAEGSAAERRVVTILYCDLVDSTGLAARLDPEDLRDVLAIYQQLAIEIVEAAGGRMARYEGDGILAYFGHPAANEDDAERGVGAGLELARRLPREYKPEENIRVRVGIATGEVVVGGIGRYGGSTPQIIGVAPNLAARLQASAEPNTVVIESGTQRLLGTLFDYRDLGLHLLKGFAEPTHMWEVLGPAEIVSRFEALRSRLPLVGRDKEMELLLQAWEAAKTGKGQVVLLSGDPGQGKSRLAHELLARIRHELPIVRRYYCSPGHKDSMLYPLLTQLQRAARFERTDSPDAKLRKLEAVIARGAEQSGEVVALLADLMALPGAERLPIPQLDPSQKREFLLDALMRGLVRLAQHKYAIVLVEDIHWVDATSAELLETVARQIVRLPVLVMVTTRPGTQPVWTGMSHVTTVALGAIDSQSAKVLAKSVAAGEELPHATLQQIAVRSAGIPLFVEELTRAAIESHTRRNTDEGQPAAAHFGGPAVPASLQASLMSRLDRLGQARDVARLASAFGREFPVEMLQAVASERGQAQLGAALKQLVSADIVLPASTHPRTTFAFRHALIQEAAYGTLLRDERKAIHARIAHVMQTQFPETMAVNPEVAARHLTVAELYEPAVACWLRAGRRAAERWALLEAAEHLSEGARLTQLLPPSPQRARRELDLQIALGPVVMALHGYPAPESLRVFSMAERLVSEVGSAQERMQVLLGLYNVHFGRAEISLALAAAREHLALAEAEGIVTGQAYTLIGQTHAAMGNFLEARTYLERALNAFARTPEVPESFSVFASQNVVSLALVAGVYFALGEPERAQAATRDSLDLARRLEHPKSIALALVTDLLTPLPGGLEPDAGRAEEVVRFCAEHRLGNFEMWARFAQGAIVARRGDPREGIGIMRDAIDAAEAMSSRLFRPVQLATVASAHAKLGDIAEALRLTVEALAIAERTGERQADAAMHRVHGELLFAAGQSADGERALRKALDIARARHAKSEELRATKSLERYLQGSRSSPRMQSVDRAGDEERLRQERGSRLGGPRREDL